MKPTIAITLGDPLGIGPEIVAKALKVPSLQKAAHWKIFGEPRANTEVRPYRKISPKQAGVASRLALEAAAQSLKNGECTGLVTAPVSKTHLALAGFPFPGHTEFLAHAFKARRIAMMLASPRLRVVLTTIHIPLKKVFSILTKDLIAEKIGITAEALKKHFGISKPRIAVCGLNPHAGEGGMFGDEEIRIIAPAIAKARRNGINATGPWPPDTVFHEALEGHFDAVLCHYHDQGLIALKTLDFHAGVNTTLGLPIIRTSPDHGCAFDIAGKNRANPESFIHAMKLCVEMVQKRVTRS